MPQPEMKLADYDFALPLERIAQHPAERRDESRLLVMPRAAGGFAHRAFKDLGAYLEAGDLLVVNDTKVIPARLFGTRATGARMEVMLVEEVARDRWLALVRPGRKAPVGTAVEFAPGFVGRVVEVLPDGSRHVDLVASDMDVREALARHGTLPLPPYIAPDPADAGRYQTIYAREEGAVAAPTAGLHFTPELLDSLHSQGIATASLTLHTGMGTFKPVTAENLADHVMHAERYALPAETVEAIARTRAAGRRVVAVGTTVARTLEHAATLGDLAAGAGSTRLFITPGYRFQVVDALITNFHLPMSTLLMLVSAFVEQVRPGEGRERVLAAYRVAIAERYRFYSFGDAMLVC